MRKQAELVWTGGLKLNGVRYFVDCAFEIDRGAWEFYADSKQLEIENNPHVRVLEGNFKSLLILDNFDCWDFGNRIPSIAYEAFCSRPSRAEAASCQHLA